MSRQHLATTTAAAVLAASAVGAPAHARPSDFGRPDAQALAARGHEHTGPDLRTPDARDRAEGRRIVASTPVKVVEVRPVPGDGFDVVDAAIGAAGTLGVVLVAAGGTRLVVRRRRDPADLLQAT